MPTAAPPATGRAAPDRTGILLVTLSALCFGTLGIFGKWGQQVGITLPTLLGLRFALAAVLLAALTRWRGQPLWPGRRAAATLAVLGLLYVAQALCYFGSLRTVPAAVTSILLYTYPVLVTAAAATLFGERPGRVGMVALAVCCVGVVAVVDPFHVGALDGSGVLLGLGSAVVYSIYILVGSRTLHGIPPLTAGTGVSLTAGMVLLTWGTLTGQLRSFEPIGLLVIAGVAVIATVVAATAFLAGLARVGAGRASVLSTLEPVSTALLAAALIGERLGGVQVGGGILVLAGAVLLGRSRR